MQRCIPAVRCVLRPVDQGSVRRICSKPERQRTSGGIGLGHGRWRYGHGRTGGGQSVAPSRILLRTQGRAMRRAPPSCARWHGGREPGGSSSSRSSTAKSWSLSSVSDAVPFEDRALGPPCDQAPRQRRTDRTPTHRSCAMSTFSSPGWKPSTASSHNFSRKARRSSVSPAHTTLFRSVSASGKGLEDQLAHTLGARRPVVESNPPIPARTYKRLASEFLDEIAL